MMDVSEAYVREWSRRLRKSDAAAAKELFTTFYPHLYRYARRITQQSEQAEDVVQETFLKLWNMRERLDPDRSLRALLFVMVRNLAYNTKDRRRRSLEDVNARPATHADPSEEIDTRILAIRLQGWIDALPDRRREAFHLSRFEDLTYEEIARIMNVSVRTVENHIRLALQDLRDHIRNYEPNLLKR